MLVWAAPAAGFSVISLMCQKEKAGEAYRTGFISLTVIDSPACTVEES
jgi:hypothetical protein